MLFRSDGAGAAYVYTRSVAGTWTQAAYLKASNAEAYDYFGQSVVFFGDTIVVSAVGEAGSITSTVGSPNNDAGDAGAVYVFAPATPTPTATATPGGPTATPTAMAMRWSYFPQVVNIYAPLGSRR